MLLCVLQHQPVSRNVPSEYHRHLELPTATIRNRGMYALAPNDLSLFLHLKSFLAGRRFHHKNVTEAVTTSFASQEASF